MDSKQVKKITVYIGIQKIDVDIIQYENDYYDITNVRQHHGRKKQWNDFIVMNGTQTMYANILREHNVEAYKVFGIKKGQKIYVHKTFLKYFLESYNMNMLDEKSLNIFNYKIKIIDDKKFLMDSNNFINASRFCKEHNKSITIFLDKLNDILPEYTKDMEENKEMQYIIQDNTDYWIHPCLVSELLIYISPLYYIKASKLLYASFDNIL